jgi:hypothetical protein
MITCTICNTQNHHLAVTCVSCRGFLQPRVENIDLFSTIWRIIERPRKTLREIAMAHHKNYILPVAGIAGIGMTFALLSVTGAGEFTINLLTLFIIGLLCGPLFGIAAVLVHSLFLLIVGKYIGTKASFKNAFAVTTYAFVPVVLSVVLLLPIEILTFGRYLFTKSPSPYMLKPLSFVILSSLDVLCGLWTIFLLLLSAKILLDTSWKRALIPLMISVGVLSLLVLVALLVLNPEVSV